MTQENKVPFPSCATCPHDARHMACMSAGGSTHKGCPTVTHTEALDTANQRYEEPETHRFARDASIQEAACYANRHERPYVMQPTKRRIQEICEFARRRGYERLGLVFCVGLKNEAGIVDQILAGNGFQVVSVCCKAGRTGKEHLGLEDQHKIFQGTDESMCNPVFQAEVLNREHTDFNILLGLCVGHDSLFFKHADAYTTVLAVKDRVTGHNPLAAVYLHGSYYRKLTARQMLVE